jgi:hypothetical protein
MRYALGNLTGGNKLARSNWELAKRLEREDESELKWWASYAFHNTTLFLGFCELAMELIIKQWHAHYASFNERLREGIRRGLEGKLLLNPVLSGPRHLLLAGAFSNSKPNFPERFWPNQEAYRSLSLGERENEVTRAIRWGDAWYQEGRNISEGEVISRDLCHAYAGFYYTLLREEAKGHRDELDEKVSAAFGRIDDSAPIVSRYVKNGFLGVYLLACDRYEEAVDYLRRAEQLSAVSGNRFADAIFMCSYAVAAARLDADLDPEVDYYLSEVDQLSRTIGGSFYPELCKGAAAAVYEMRGEKTKAQRLRLESEQGRAGRRILNIFRGGGK